MADINGHTVKARVRDSDLDEHVFARPPQVVWDHVELQLMMPYLFRPEYRLFHQHHRPQRWPVNNMWDVRLYDSASPCDPDLVRFLELDPPSSGWLLEASDG